MAAHQAAAVVSFSMGAAGVAGAAGAAKCVFQEEGGKAAVASRVNKCVNRRTKRRRRSSSKQLTPIEYYEEREKNVVVI